MFDRPKGALRAAMQKSDLPIKNWLINKKVRSSGGFDSLYAHKIFNEPLQAYSDMLVWNYAPLRTLLRSVPGNILENSTWYSYADQSKWFGQLVVHMKNSKLLAAQGLLDPNDPGTFQTPPPLTSFFFFCHQINNIPADLWLAGIEVCPNKLLPIDYLKTIIMS